MKDDLDFNVKFIELVQERPCLYDFNRSDYSNRNSQDAAWLEIAKKVNESVTDCKERWKNLRGCYTRHLKNCSRPTGSSTKIIKPYYLADHLQFLNRYTKPRTPKGISRREEHTIEIEQKILNEIDSDIEDSQQLDSPSATPQADRIEAENYSRSNQISKKRKKGCSEVNANDIEYFQSGQNIAMQTDNQDPDFAFMYSLLPDMKDMNRDQKRRFKMGVLQLASDLLNENSNSYTAIPQATNIFTVSGSAPPVNTDSTVIQKHESIW